ncbi:ATP-binding cassette domain-containing protein [Pyruvatibacter mobilis]|uniref:ATP-binding cassette domain-containing protein n=1 Tax=Pyruvatibacter mobilis TaxID=1712261 RepID=UPI003BAD2366
MSHLIEARGLAVTIGGRTLLHDISLSVDEGEIVTIIGPNGGGKTTLVRALLGTRAISAGSVQRVQGLTIGYVPQRLELNPMMPVTVARLMTGAARRPRHLIIEALEETGVAHLVDQSVHTLSGGEFRRVLLARALLRDPQLLVLDEPVAGVDHAGELALYELIKTIRDQRGCGVLMVSHDLHVVMAATDKVICLNGHVCCTGQPHEVSQHAEYVRLFGPRASEALAFYEHQHDHEHDLSGEEMPHGCGHDHDHDHSHQKDHHHAG